MTEMDLEARFARLEGDVAHLKKLAVNNQKPKRLSFVVKLLIFLAAVAAVLLVALPFITAALTTEFEKIQSGLTIDQ